MHYYHIDNAHFLFFFSRIYSNVLLSVVIIVQKKEHIDVNWCTYNARSPFKTFVSLDDDNEKKKKILCAYADNVIFA